MSIDRLGSELEALGVSGHNLRCLLLLPQVYVGWASQRRQVAALEVLLDGAAQARCRDARGNGDGGRVVVGLEDEVAADPVPRSGVGTVAGHRCWPSCASAISCS